MYEIYFATSLNCSCIKLKISSEKANLQKKSKTEESS